jgi:hypothetical protein
MSSSKGLIRNVAEINSPKGWLIIHSEGESLSQVGGFRELHNEGSVGMKVAELERAIRGNRRPCLMAEGQDADAGAIRSEEREAGGTRVNTAVGKGLSNVVDFHVHKQAVGCQIDFSEGERQFAYPAFGQQACKKIPARLERLLQSLLLPRLAIPFLFGFAYHFCPRLALYSLLLSPSLPRLCGLLSAFCDGLLVFVFGNHCGGGRIVPPRRFHTI